MPPLPESAKPLRLEYLDPDQLDEHPSNWKFHPPAQMDAIVHSINSVGWARPMLYNERTKRLLDGHGRKKLPREVLIDGKYAPVLIGSWDEATENAILALVDPTAALFEVDAKKLNALLDAMPTLPSAVDSFLHVQADMATITALEESDDKPPPSVVPFQSDPATVVTAVLPCRDVAVVEKALVATGQMNRGEALKIICEAFLKANGPRP